MAGTRPDIETIEDALDSIAEWLVARYRQRIAVVSLTLEGFYAIARWIVDRHEGSITIESAPGKGALVAIALPRLEAAA